MKKLTSVSALLLTILFSLFVFSQDEINERPFVLKNMQIQGKKIIAPGDNAEIILTFELDKEHYIYWESLKLKVIEPKGLLVGNIRTEKIVNFFDNNSRKMRKGISGGLHDLNFLIETPLDTKQPYFDLELEIYYQACTKNYCLFPKKETISVSLPSRKTDEKNSSENQNKGMEALLKNLTPGSSSTPKTAWWIIISIFFAGVLTSFTPCVLPLIPLTFSALKNTPRNPFLMSLSYVLGMSGIYSLIGLASALTGQIFGSFLGSPLVSGFLGLLFFILGLALLDVFPWPTPFENFLAKPRKIKNFRSAFLVGGFAALIASPCVGPVLFGILAYVAQGQDVFYGFMALLIFSLGLGLPFLILGTFSSKITKLPKLQKASRFFKIILALSMFGLSIFYFKPLYSYVKYSFVKVEKSDLWTPYTEEAFHQALRDKKPIVIDFWASWCVSCEELEVYSFTHPEVKKLRSEFIFLKFDATNKSELLEKLKKQYSILGLPFVTFYSKEGQWLEELTLKGFESGEKLSKRLQKVLNYHENNASE